MKLLEFRKVKVGNLAKFLIAVTLLTSGIFSIQYLANAFNITDVTPNTGSVIGGQEVTITGDFTYNPIQQMTADYCTNEMSVFPTGDNKPDTITLTDTRNNQDYRIRKMADGKCWMIDNLKLELTDGMKLTPDDTNVTIDTVVTLATGGLTGNFTTKNYLTADNSNTTGTDYDNYNAWRQVNPSDPNLADTERCRTNDGVTYNIESKTGCGYLYNYYTATAGTATNVLSNQYSIASGSICPAGWRLPTGLLGAGDKTNDFSTLDIAYGGTGAYQTGTIINPPEVLVDLWWPAGAWQGVFTGTYTNRVRLQGDGGGYLSASIQSARGAYYVSFSGYNIYPGTTATDRNYGFGVRCVVDEDYVPEPVGPVVPTVTVGGVAAQITAWSDTSITFITPVHSAGKVDVVVSRGSQTFTLANAYEYFNVPDVPNTGVSKTSATTTAVQSGLTVLIIIAIGTAIFAIKHKITKQR
jgi:hypothetical protein